MKPLSSRVVLVGCGGIARTHVHAIGADNIVAVGDANLQVAARLRDEFGLDAPIFASLEDALEQKPDVVVVCTPPATHFDLVRCALEAGADVLCEKPLALRASDAWALVELARSQGKTLRTAAKYRFCEGVLAAKQLEPATTGALLELRITFGSAFDFKRSWHGDLPVSGGGVWMDNGPHALDLARHFAGGLHLERVLDWQSEGELETAVRLGFRSTSAVSVEIALSWLDPCDDPFVWACFERGTLEVGWNQTVWHQPDSSPRVLAGAYSKAACFAGNWNAFLTCDAICHAEDGARVVELLETVLRAAQN